MGPWGSLVSLWLREPLTPVQIRGGPLITSVPDLYILNVFTNFVTFLTESIESLPHDLDFLDGFHILPATVEHLRCLR